MNGCSIKGLDVVINASFLFNNCYSYIREDVLASVNDYRLFLMSGELTRIL